MKTFEYTIQDEIGIHARPAGALIKEAKSFESVIRIKCGEKKADVTGIMAVLGLGVKHGDRITVEVEGADEEKACIEMQRYFEEHL